jgi:tRNA (guanine37-N1)-methyltransferase
MDVAVLSIFPELFAPFLSGSIIRRAVEKGIINASVTDIREFAHDRHRTVDDRPYGGGCGMVMKPEPLAEAIRNAKDRQPLSKTLLMTPQGIPFNQQLAEKLAHETGLIIVCGRYEGIDERISADFIDLEISIGDYVLNGGELAAMVIIEAVTRLIPGALGKEESARKDSFSDGLIEHAHYTRPPEFEGQGVPEVLLSGNHREIENWRLETSLIRTFLKRPDLLKDRSLSKQETRILKKWCLDIEHILQAQSECGSGSLSGNQ